VPTGEVVAALREVAGTRSVALTGDPMTTAARLQQMAEPNEILVDDATFWAAEPRISVEAAGEKLLRGQRRPVQVHRLRGEKIHLSYPCREAAPLIGRDGEKARIGELLRKAAETGKATVLIQDGKFLVGANPIPARYVNSLVTIQ